MLEKFEVGIGLLGVEEFLEYEKEVSEFGVLLVFEEVGGD